MKDEIRIRLSVGLIVVAVLHAVLLGAVFTALHRTPKPQARRRVATSDSATRSASWAANREAARAGPGEPGGPRRTQAAIRLLPAVCPPVVRPTIRPYRVVPASPVVQPATPSPTTVPAPTVPAPIIVTPTNSNGNAVPQPSPKRYQIALFVGNDAKSRATAGLVQQRREALEAPKELRVPGLHRKQRPLQNSLRGHRAGQPVPRRPFPGFNRRSRPCGRPHDVAFDSGGTVRRSATRLRTLSANSPSPEDRSTEIARLFLGLRDLADAATLSRRLSGRLLPDRTDRAHMATLRSGS